MSSYLRRSALLGTALLSVSSAMAADFGRSSGTFTVSSSGSATYTIPIWTPPGPNGVTPSISLNYSSQGGNGLAGMGWNLSAARSIERCPRTKHQDGSVGAVALSTSDRYCIAGNRLRLYSGAYGTRRASVVGQRGRSSGFGDA